MRNAFSRGGGQFTLGSAGRLTQLLNAVFALESLSRVDSFLAVVEMVLKRSARLGLAAL
jgi:hypothetical protein